MTDTSPVLDFDTATALTPAESSTGAAVFAWEVPDGWQQGRGAWGGLPIGAMVRATMLTEPDPARSVRTLSVQLLTPALAGPHTVAVAPVRIGSGMSTWAVSVTDAEGGTVGGGSIITAAPRRTSTERDESSWSPIRAPEVPASGQVPLSPTPPPFPPFTRKLEYRVNSGFPLQGGSAETLGWSSYREPTPWTAASLIALADAWYTVTLVSLADLVPMSTVNFTANLLIDPASLAPGEALLHHGLLSSVREGFTSEQRRLWTSDGRLAVDNLQTIVVG
jgi:hypothetical protein